MAGVVLAFEEIRTVRRLADDIAGTKAFYTFEHLIGKVAGSSARSGSCEARGANGRYRASPGGDGHWKRIICPGHPQRRPPLQKFFYSNQLRCDPLVTCSKANFLAIRRELLPALRRAAGPANLNLPTAAPFCLDEIGDMPPGMQVKLLRVLQSGEVYRIGAQKPMVVDTRIIACTHVDLSRAVAKGVFREDLFYRAQRISHSHSDATGEGRRYSGVSQLFPVAQGGISASVNLGSAGGPYRLLLAG